jgi:hypothetical protein
LIARRERADTPAACQDRGSLLACRSQRRRLGLVRRCDADAIYALSAAEQETSLIGTSRFRAWATEAMKPTNRSAAGRTATSCPASTMAHRETTDPADGNCW